MLNVCKEMLTSAKLRGSWYLKVYFLKLHMCVYLGTKMQVSRIILTSFRWMGVISPHTSKWTPKKPTQIRVNTCHNDNFSCGVSSDITNSVAFSQIPLFLFHFCHGGKEDNHSCIHCFQKFFPTLELVANVSLDDNLLYQLILEQTSLQVVQIKNDLMYVT